jgi:hypothetical protein
MLSTAKTATEILTELFSQWGERDVYPLTVEEFSVLKEIAESSVLNRDNGDGTFYHEVCIENKKFALSTKGKI